MKYFFYFVFDFIGSVMVLGGFGTLFYQIYFWLRHSEWLNWTLGGVLEGLLSFLIPNFENWYNIPADWFGWHKIIKAIFWFMELIPLALILILVGYPLARMGSKGRKENKV